jgi:hypothetical protein
MKRIFLLLTLLSSLGCQTAKHTCPIIPQTDKVTIKAQGINKRGMIATPSEKNPTYGVQLHIYKENKVASAPKITTKPNEWGNIDVALDIIPIDQRANVLIEDEIISINCEPGIHFKVKVIPLKDDMVHLKGVYVLSKAPENDLMAQKEVFPFSIYCKLGEEVTLHNVVTKKVN